MAVFEGLDPELEFRSPLLELGAASWLASHHGNCLPRRCDIDPLKLPRAILPHTLLIDVVAGQVPRFRWRLLGTHITRILGRDSTGKYIEDVLPANMYDEFVMPLLWVIANRQPIRVFGGAEHVGKDWVPFENYIAPLVDEQGVISMMFGVALYGEPSMGMSKRIFSPLGTRI